MASSVCWYGHVLRKEDGLVVRRVFECEVEGNGGQTEHGRGRLRMKT